MSYSVRDDGAILGQGAAVEFPNGAAAAFQGKIQALEFIGQFGIDAANVTTAHRYCVFVAPPAATNASGVLNLGGSYQIVGGTIIVDTASTSGTLAIEVRAPGTPSGSGVNVQSGATTSLAAGGAGVAATTPASLSLNTNVDNLLIPNGGRVNFIYGGTLTGLVNLNCTLYIARIS